MTQVYILIYNNNDYAFIWDYNYSIQRGKQVLTLSIYKEVGSSVYKEIEDEVLVGLAKSGDSLALDYLMYKYRNFVRAKSRSYFLIGADKEDIMQEGINLRLLELLQNFV